MASPPDFDLAAAHKYFAAHCFNKAWDLIEKPNRSAEEDRLMVALNQASLYHWMNRPDCKYESLSIGYWQASRIQSLLRNTAEAQRYAEVCVQYSSDLEPFYRGYAHEALARAAFMAGNQELGEAHVHEGRMLAGLVAEADERDALLKDLDTICSG